MRRIAILALITCALPCFGASHANRLTYLDSDDPFYPGPEFPKLTTPQWVGERDVEAVVILAVDDMRETPRYETFLRPILERLKQIDGRAPVSIMVNGLTPTNAQLQAWLKEGLSLDVHTLAHPCPLLAKGNFQAAADTYHGCVELLNLVPGNQSVAFRMPCCDSMNSPSPRFYAEIFNRTSPGGQFLTIDSSVMNIPSPKFRKYLPSETNAITKVSMGSFVTTIDDYPYPYVIGRLCWEFPAMVPSDWEANNLHGPTNGITVEDWKWALDDTVKKQGTFTFIFHPHGWITSRQMIEFIDYAVATHGPRVKFLTFREAQERLDKHLLAGQALRDARGGDNGARLLDLNDDGFLDVVGRKTRVWDSKARSWREVESPGNVAEARFGILDSPYAMMFAGAQAWRFDGQRWIEDVSLAKGLKGDGVFRDADNDDNCEFITDNGVFAWSAGEKTWKPAGYALPKGATLNGGLRFVDVNGDGYDDLLFSDEKGFGLHQFVSKANPRLTWKIGWNDQVVVGARNDPRAIPPIVREGKNNNGVWFRNGHMWIQNEDTAHLPDKVDRRSFKQLLTLDDPPSKSPQESLALMKVRPGFKVELVASEPLVTDPVAFDWGADGKLWVVEMRDYPLGINGKAGGQVKYLEDLDGDGAYDRATVLLDGLKYPNGVMAWRDGVLVSAAPDILYADANGKKVLFTGFTEGNPQHLLNGFDYGLDNWIYGANGDSGGKVKGNDLNGHDFRFRPDDGAFEVIEGQTQFGRHRDDWGNWFGNNNPTWLWHYALPEHYLTRNPQLPVKTTKQITTEITKAFPITRIRQRFNDPHQAGHVTSGNSVTPYRDDVFGPEFADSVFISEPVHNLVHREVLVEDGVSFHSHRATDEKQSEFLASGDYWFRPTMLRTGPDGALYIADMYRMVLEHPEWITKDIQARLDLRAGDDKGRIYRVYPEGVTLRKIPRMEKLDTAGLVQAMDSPNGWQRDTAQRLLAHAKAPKAKPLLTELMRKSRRPKVRLQALCTLDAFGPVARDALQAAMKDPHSAVRENAVRLAEPMQALEMASDPSLWVLFQLAFRLGDTSDRKAGEALFRIAEKTSTNTHLQAAVLSSAPRHVETLVSVIGRTVEPPAFLVEHVAKLATIDRKDVGKLTGHSSAPTRLAAMAGLLDAGKKLDENELQRAREIASRTAATEAERLAAVRLLGRSDKDEDVLVRLLWPQNSSGIQKAAMSALRRQVLPGLGEILIENWKHLSPSIRNETVTLLLSRSEYTGALLEAVEAGKISRNEIGPAHQQTAQRLGERAREVFSAAQSNRSSVLKDYEKVAQMKGEAAKGATLFQQNCATCHRFKGQGTDLAPELGMVANKSVEALLIAILDPNQAIEQRYIAYNATTKDGREINGIIMTETANSITLRSPGGIEETILRANLKDITSSALSLMPEGLEAALPPQGMADLIAYILGD